MKGVWALAVAFFLAAIPVLAAEPVFLPGSAWGIVPPPGFKTVTDVAPPAFVHESGAVIFVYTTGDATDPSKFAPVGGITGDGENQTRVESIEEMTVGGRKAYLISTRFLQKPMQGLNLAIQGETSGTIIAVLPDEALQAVPLAEVKAALLTAIERPQTLEDRLVEFPLAITDFADMRLVSTISGIGAILTDGPIDTIDEGHDQAFSMLITLDPPVAALSVESEGPDLTARLQAVYPDVAIRSSILKQTPGGPVIEMTFKRPDDGTVPRDGIVWARIVGNRMLMMISQIPPGNTALLDRLARVRDGVSPK